MRMMLKAVVDTEAGNEAFRNGSMIKAIEQMVQELHPEATYFTASDDGQRSCLVVFDMADSSQIPVISEPLFHGARARVTLTPCMDLGDLQAGLSRVPADVTSRGT
ncbi:hypothetical protein LY71_104284 [Geodermatophilus tzadiensis]|uniref:Uncharacterized protein n=1 Tax=Geodermatophilus tzadiensis TaxID=1137988 RepID=A0A2T0TX51_9ACTN|nr:hypothetical protein [Geodermatophilus tzadiensis]PRY50247.1 hypothetical protein LY71_104284 [Geodermatophilus tzadiensis]